jgi:hypothetical protein
VSDRQDKIMAALREKVASSHGRAKSSVVAAKWFFGAIPAIEAFDGAPNDLVKVLSIDDNDTMNYCTITIAVACKSEKPDHSVLHVISGFWAPHLLKGLFRDTGVQVNEIYLEQPALEKLRELGTEHLGWKS